MPWRPAATARNAAALEGLILSGRVRAIAAGSSESEAGLIYVEASSWEELRRRVRTTLDAYHAEYPLRIGLPREDLRSRLGIEPRRLDLVVAALQSTGDATAHGPRIARVGFEPNPSREDEARLADVRRTFEFRRRRHPRFKIADWRWATSCGLCRSPEGSLSRSHPRLPSTRRSIDVWSGRSLTA
jgi:hypothetical protein